MMKRDVKKIEEKNEIFISIPLQLSKYGTYHKFDYIIRNPENVAFYQYILSLHMNYGHGIMY